MFQINTVEDLPTSNQGKVSEKALTKVGFLGKENKEKESRAKAI